MARINVSQTHSNDHPQGSTTLQLDCPGIGDRAAPVSDVHIVYGVMEYMCVCVFAQPASAYAWKLFLAWRNGSPLFVAVMMGLAQCRDRVGTFNTGDV